MNNLCLCVINIMFSLQGIDQNEKNCKYTKKNYIYL